MVGRKIGVAVATLATLICAQSAQATVTWSLQTMPSTVEPNGTLKAVSCPGSTSCTAVGSAFDTTGAGPPLVEHWGGMSWAVQSAPVLAGSVKDDLQAVSCPTLTACFAMGEYGAAGVPSGLFAEHWDGTAWHVRAVPAPDSTTPWDRFTVTGLSCWSASACLAVGYYYAQPAYEDFAFAERWNGSNWQLTPSPDPPGASVTQLYGVSCASATKCVAVGSWGSPEHYMQPLAEQWDGTGWHAQITPHDAGSVNSAFHGIGCSSASACTAVGTAAGLLIERWNGSAWVRQTASTPAGTIDPRLDAVSCPSATSCTAVGGIGDPNLPREPPLAERWDGSSWRVESIGYPQNQTGTSFLTGVSCSAAAACTSVGQPRYPFKGTLAERWNGSTWQPQATVDPAGAVGPSMTGVSCRSPTDCVAVGEAAAETWDGSGWRLDTIPGWNGGSAGATRVSCTSPIDCTAVGGDHAALYNGKSWQSEKMAIPPGQSDVTLDGVSCTSSTACLAVGSELYIDEYFGDYYSALAERWNGSTWTALTLPFGLPQPLNSVSCVTSSDCIAIANSSAVHWNGKTWTAETLPLPAGAAEARLLSVSCATATACAAVGWWTSTDPAGYNPRPLAERFNGAKWQIEPVPSLTGTSSANLRGIDCSSATSCTAVGEYASAETQHTLPSAHTLAVIWSAGHWQISQTPDIHSLGTGLYAVSCTSATVCTAVGSFGFDNGNPLAERSS